MKSAAINVYTVGNKYKYETYNDWGFTKTDKLTNQPTDILLLSHLLMDEHLAFLRTLFFSFLQLLQLFNKQERRYVTACIQNQFINNQIAVKTAT